MIVGRNPRHAVIGDTVLLRADSRRGVGTIVDSDEILVLHHGKVVERGSTKEVLQDPKDEYTTKLLDEGVGSGKPSRGLCCCLLIFG